MDGHPRTTSPRPAAALIAVTLLALTACAAEPSPEALVTRLADDRASEDEIPHHLLPEGTTADTVRLLVDHDGVRFYVATAERDDDEAVCLVLHVVTDGEDDGGGGGSSCLPVALLDDDGVGLDVTLTDPGVHVDALLVPDGTTPVTDLPAVTTNLFATVAWHA